MSSRSKDYIEFKKDRHNLSLHMKYLISCFPAYHNVAILRHHAKTKMTNNILLRHELILSKLLSGNELQVRRTHVFGVEEVPYLLYETAAGIIYIFGTLYHVLIGVLMPDGSFDRCFIGLDV